MLKWFPLALLLPTLGLQPALTWAHSDSHTHESSGPGYTAIPGKIRLSGGLSATYREDTIAEDEIWQIPAS